MVEQDKVELTDIFGHYGPFQRRVFLFVVTVSMFKAYHNLIVTVVAPNIDHWCSRPPEFVNLTSDEWKEFAIPKETKLGKERYSQCTMRDLSESTKTAYCDTWEYDTGFYGRTIVEEWNLVCSRSWLVSLSQSVYMAGYMTSMIIFGHLSDRLGRRIIIRVTLPVLLVAGFSTLLSQSFITFIALRYFVSLGVSGACATAFVLLMEVAGPDIRASLGLANEFGWATGYMLLALASYFISSWFYVQLVVMIVGLFLVVGLWIIPESPRWLMANKEFGKARKVIMEAVERNAKSKTEGERKVALLKAQLEEEESKSLMRRATFLDLLYWPLLRRRTLVLYFCWFVNSFTYYAMSLNTNDLGGNAYLNFAIAGAVEFPAIALAIFIIKKLGRRVSQCGCMVFAGVACLLNILIPEDMLWAKITFAMMGKFLITSSYGILYVYSSEIFPTVVRNVGMGSSSTFARIGAIIAPFVKELGRATYQTVPFGVYGTICILSGVSVLMLPETKGAQLPDTIFEAETPQVNAPNTTTIEMSDSGSTDRPTARADC